MNDILYQDSNYTVKAVNKDKFIEYLSKMEPATMEVVRANKPHPSVEIIYDDQSYSVLYTNSRGNTSDIGYGDKHTSMEDHAQNLYELVAALGGHVEMREV